MSAQGKQYNVAVIGATGVVGLEFLKIAAERRFPIGSPQAARDRALRRQAHPLRRGRDHRRDDDARRRSRAPTSSSSPPPAPPRASTASRPRSRRDRHRRLQRLAPGARCAARRARGEPATTSTGTRTSSPSPTARRRRSCCASGRCTSSTASRASSPTPTSPSPAPAPPPSPSSTSSRAPGRRARSPRPRLPARDRLQRPAAGRRLHGQRLHEGGVEDDGRDAQDHARAGSAALRDLRPRARLLRATASPSMPSSRSR